MPFATKTVNHFQWILGPGGGRSKIRIFQKKIWIVFLKKLFKTTLGLGSADFLGFFELPETPRNFLGSFDWFDKSKTILKHFLCRNSPQTLVKNGRGLPPIRFFRFFQFSQKLFAVRLKYLGRGCNFEVFKSPWRGLAIALTLILRFFEKTRFFGHIWPYWGLWRG